MDIEKRLSNLEDMVRALTVKVDRIKSYMDNVTDAENIGITENYVTSTGCEDAVCELSESTDTSIAALEQALCDLSEEIGG